MKPMPDADFLAEVNDFCADAYQQTGDGGQRAAFIDSMCRKAKANPVKYQTDMLEGVAARAGRAWDSDAVVSRGSDKQLSLPLVTIDGQTDGYLRYRLAKGEICKIRACDAEVRHLVAQMELEYENLKAVNTAYERRTKQVNEAIARAKDKKPQDYAAVKLVDIAD